MPVLVVSGIYHGIVGENGGIVDVTPEIRAENGPICGYRIVNTHKGKIPFEVIIMCKEKISIILVVYAIFLIIIAP